jgi:hypothetical protein
MRALAFCTLAWAVLALALAGCGSAPKPEISYRTQVVNEAVATSCVPPTWSPSSPPPTKAALAALTDAAARYDALAAAYFALAPAFAADEQMLATCAKAGTK